MAAGRGGRYLRRMKPAKSKKSPEKAPAETLSAPPARPVPPETAAPSAIPQEKVAERARSIWEERGRPSDQDLDIWLEAERQLGKVGERDPIQPRLDQIEPEDSLKSDVEEELDEETSEGSRRSATSL